MQDGIVVKLSAVPLTAKSLMNFSPSMLAERRTYTRKRKKKSLESSYVLHLKHVSNLKPLMLPNSLVVITTVAGWVLGCTVRADASLSCYGIWTRYCNSF